MYLEYACRWNTVLHRHWTSCTYHIHYSSLGLFLYQYNNDVIIIINRVIYERSQSLEILSMTFAAAQWVRECSYFWMSGDISYISIVPGTKIGEIRPNSSVFEDELSKSAFSFSANHLYSAETLNTIVENHKK